MYVRATTPATVQDARSIQRIDLMREARHISVTRSPSMSVPSMVMSLLCADAKDVAKAFGGWVGRRPGLMTTLTVCPDQPAEPCVPCHPAACAPAGVDACVPPDNHCDGNVRQGGKKVEVGGNIWLRRWRRGRGEMSWRVSYCLFSGVLGISFKCTLIITMP